MEEQDKRVFQYAERRLKTSESPKGLLVITGGLLLAGAGCLIWLLYAESQETGVNLIANGYFLAGIAYAVLFMLATGAGAVGIVRGFSPFRRMDRKVYELLLRLRDKKD